MSTTVPSSKIKTSLVALPTVRLVTISYSAVCSPLFVSPCLARVRGPAVLVLAMDDPSFIDHLIGLDHLMQVQKFFKVNMSARFEFLAM